VPGELVRGRLDVVGLGPAGSEHLTKGTLELLAGAGAVFLRTSRHPAAKAVFELRPDATSFDECYESAEAFEELYMLIAERLLQNARQVATVYAVPGSPAVAERSVELLRQKAVGSGVEVVVHPAVSFLDLAFERTGLDPATGGLRIIDAAFFARQAAGQSGPFLVVQAWSRQILSEVKLALEEPAPGQRAVVLHHLGLPDEVVAEVTWADLDRFEPDHLTSIFVPDLARAPGAELVSLASTVAELRRRCPWDRAQTHRSLERHLMEESFEALEALDALGEDARKAGAAEVEHVEEELGDLLCQVVFHATLAEEEGLFVLADVARRLEEKLVSRHPHVFGDETADSAAHVAANWERAKDRQLNRTHLFEGIPLALPSLARAEKFERKLKSAGLGYPVGSSESTGVLPPATDEDSLGELLFDLVRRAASEGADAEGALRRRLSQVAAHVLSLEQAAAANGTSLGEELKKSPLPSSQPPL
jgi:tetrapyrrole methylase family protein/MazG family protein